MTVHESVPTPKVRFLILVIDSGGEKLEPVASQRRRSSVVASSDHVQS